MAYNPFLSMNEPSAPATTDVLNPFMMTDSEPSDLSGDNPFATSNPFSDFGGGGYEPPAGDTVPVDIFGGAEPTGAKHFEGFTEDTTAPLDIFASSMTDERMVKPTELDLVSTTTDHTFLEEETQGPQPPARPLPPETQNLILSVTGQMEFTSSHLLDRIPPTRTPSPVSVRDIHSSCPTPEPEPLEEVATDSFDINRNKPMRPPPARPPPVARPPPPRPTPPPPRPAVPPAPAPAPAPTHHPDDINLFDAPVPVAVKPTKEDILSLYAAPKVEKPIDFLSDDITDHITNDTSQDMSLQQQPFANEVPTSSSMVISQAEPEPEEPSTVSVSQTSPFTATAESTIDTVAPMDCSEPHTEIASATSNNSPFADTAKDEFESQPTGLEVEGNPFESAIDTETSTNVFADSGVDIFGVSKTEDVVMAPSGSDIFNTHMPQSDDMFSNAQDNAFGEVSMSGVDESKDSLFGAAPKEIAAAATDAFDMGGGDAFESSAVTPSVDPGWGAPAEGMMQGAFSGGADAFDAFSAKFDATSSNNLNSGGLLWAITCDC